MSNTAITPFQPQSIEQAAELAERLAKSALLPDALRGKPADVLVTLLTGHELGLSPMQAIRGLHVIRGKAIMSADLTVALVKKHSECLFFRLVETTDTAATYETERRGEGKTRMSFTLEQAKVAGLLGSDTWKKYPAAMLRARCASALARAVYPDLTLGIYDPDEAKDISSANDSMERDITPPVQARPASLKTWLSQPSVEAETAAVDTEASAPAPEAGPPPQEGRQLSKLEQVLALLEEAQSRADMDKVAPRIKRELTKREQEEVRPVWARRAKEIAAAAEVGHG